MQTRINREGVIKLLEHLKNLKTGRVSYLALELIMHVTKKPIPFRETVTLSDFLNDSKVVF